MPPRLALLTIGHPDYPNAVGEAHAQAAAGVLVSAGAEVLGAPQALTDPLAAGAAAREVLKQEPDGVLLLLGTWIECATATAAIREIEHLPFAVWAFPMYEVDGRRESTGSLVALLALQPALRRMGYRFKTLVGFPEDPAFQQSALAFARAAHATQRLKRTRLGLVGYTAMSIYPGTFDHVLLRRHLGPEVVHLDTYTLLQAAARAGDQAAADTAGTVSAQCGVEVAPERLRKAGGLAAGAAALVREHHLDALNVKCQYELSQGYGMTACVPMACLAEQGVVASCEGDVMVTVSQALLHYLTAQTTTYGDILDVRDGRVLLSSCGFAPFDLAHEAEERAIRELDYPGFDGIICSFVLREGPVTLVRLAEGQGDYYLVYATGRGVTTSLRQGRFPALEIELDGCPDRLLEQAPSQHFALAYGDLSPELEDFSRILGLEAIRI